MVSRFSLRRLFGTLTIAAITAFVAMNPGKVRAFYEELYPSDPARREALELCFARNHQFNRLDPDQRAICYRDTLIRLGEPILAQSADQTPAANPVDLWRAAAMGALPRNDIRRQEDERNAVPSSH
jgi:hypothetical protein